MTTLALDLGQHIGWVKGSTVGPLEHGTIDLPDTRDLGVWLMAAMMALPPLMVGADDIAVEQPFLGDSYFPARKLLGLLGAVYACANTRGISGNHVNEIPVPTAKLALAGHGRAEKPQMIAAACEIWGFEEHEIDEHQADASAILYVHLFGERPKIGGRKSRSSKGVSILRGPAR